MAISTSPECAYQLPPAPTPVEIQYTQADLRELEALGEEQRGKGGPAKEFLSQVQILRTIGGYLDRNRAKLLRVTNNFSSGEEFSLRVEYLNVDGERTVDDRLWRRDLRSLHRYVQTAEKTYRHRRWAGAVIFRCDPFNRSDNMKK